MPLWIAFIKDHWLSLLLILGIVVAFLFVYANRKLLFYKE
jgi:hypothetical protein